MYIWLDRRSGMMTIEHELTFRCYDDETLEPIQY